MKARIAAVLFGFVASGCVATAGTSGGYVTSSPQPVVQTTVTTTTSEPAYVEEPDLVEINGGVRVVYDAEEPVFYSDNFYWRFGDDGSWYRSSVHTGGWTVYNDVPVHVRSIERPREYRRYRPSNYTPRPRPARPANYQPRPAEHDRPGYQPRPVEHDRPGYQPRPAEHDRPAYNPQPAERPGYQPKPAERPGYTPQPAERPGYQPKPAERPGYTPAPAQAGVAGIHRPTSSSARGWLDTGDKPQYDNRVRFV